MSNLIVNSCSRSHAPLMSCLRVSLLAKTSARPWPSKDWFCIASLTIVLLRSNAMRVSDCCGAQSSPDMALGASPAS